MDPATALTQMYGQAAVSRGVPAVISGEELVSFLTEGGGAAKVDSASSDMWIREDLPVLVRDGVGIVPVAWIPPGVEPESGGPRSQIRSACDYRAGNYNRVSLRPGPDATGYASSLAEAGAESAVWWAFGDLALVMVSALVDGGTTVAVHLVPTAWVSERRHEPSPQVDLRWTWGDVVRLFETAHPGR